MHTLAYKANLLILRVIYTTQSIDMWSRFVHMIPIFERLCYNTFPCWNANINQLCDISFLKCKGAILTVNLCLASFMEALHLRHFKNEVTTIRCRIEIKHLLTMCLSLNISRVLTCHVLIIVAANRFCIFARHLWRVARLHAFLHALLCQDFSTYTKKRAKEKVKHDCNRLQLLF